MLASKIEKFIQSKIFVVVILALAVLLRSLYFTAYPFGFDQIQIAENATQITQGKLTLIGPRTGPADMFTGPLIYYIAAIWTLFINPAFASVLTAISISLGTGIALYFLCRRYLSSDLALPITILWAFSPLLIHFDRIPWNPNLTVLAASLSFFPLLKEDRLKFLDIVLVSLGVFLGYQAHFSGLLLLPLVLICLVLRKEIKPIPYLLPIISFAASLAPTILFDYRHNWLNYNGLVSLVTNKDSVDSYLMTERFFQKAYIVVETIGKIFFQGSHSALIISSGLAILISFYFLRNTSKVKSSLKNWPVVFPSVWILCVVLFFSLYRNSTPEYYFFILLPVILYMISTVLIKLKVRALYLFLIAALYACIFTSSTFSVSKDISLGSSHNAARKIAQIAETTPISGIIYDMKPVESLGVAYFIKQQSVQMIDSGSKVHIAYPAATDHHTYFIDNLSIWIDPRNKADYAYFSEDGFILGVPQTWKVMHIKTPEDALSLNQASYLIDTNSPQGTFGLTVADNDPSVSTQTTQPNALYLETARKKFTIHSLDKQLTSLIAVF